MSQLSTFYSPLTAADLGLGNSANVTFGSVATGAVTTASVNASGGTLDLLTSGISRVAINASGALTSLATQSGSLNIGPALSTTSLGTRAINIQSGRAAAANVAANADSIAIGNNARTAGTESVAIGLNARSGGQGSVVIGWGADSSTQATSVGWGSYAHGGGCAFGQGARGDGDGGIAMGQSATCSQFRSMVVGYAGAASAQEAVALGSSANASAQNAVAIGTSVTSSLRGEFATRPFRSVVWGGQTTNNVATILNLDFTATNRLTLAANTALIADIMLIARRSDVNDKWLIARRWLGIRRDGSNNTALIGTVQTIGTDQSAGSPTWTFALTADDTNEALQLEVTGATGETVVWRAVAFYRTA